MFNGKYHAKYVYLYIPIGFSVDAFLYRPTRHLTGILINCIENQFIMENH